MQEGLEKGIEKVEKQKEIQKEIQIAKNLLECGDTIEKVAQVTGLAITEIQNLQK